MTAAAAQMIVDAVPVDMASMVREAVLSPHQLTYALLSAHLIIFWLSQDSNVTPPVALAAFTAAAIAGTKPMVTGFQSWKLAKGLYVIPLLFAYTPFIGGSWADDLTIFFFALFGLYAFAASLEGFMEARLNLLVRLLSFGCAVALLWPAPWWVHSLGLVILLGLFITSFRTSRRETHELSSMNEPAASNGASLG
jgi:TRAP-type uncharacterized transport system fused permease subunit